MAKEELTPVTTQWTDSVEIAVAGSSEQLNITYGQVNKLICKDATMQECMMFLSICKSVGANPWLKDVHLIKYSANAQPAYVSGIGFFEKKAQLNPKFRGYGSTQWMNEAGEWKDVFIANTLGFGKNPIACKASCYVEGYQSVQEQTVTWDESNAGNKTWSKMPSVMIEKVAKVRLLRKLFSAELAGLYTHEERHLQVDTAPIKEAPALIEAEYSHPDADELNKEHAIIEQTEIEALTDSIPLEPK